MRRLEIRNFGILKEFKADLSRITVLVGRNGTGKSTLLEAAALALSAPSEFRDILGFDVADYVSRRKYYIYNIVTRSSPSILFNENWKIELYTKYSNLFCGKLLKDTIKEIAEDVARKSQRNVSTVMKEIEESVEFVAAGYLNSDCRIAYVKLGRDPWGRSDTYHIIVSKDLQGWEKPVVAALLARPLSELPQIVEEALSPAQMWQLVAKLRHVLPWLLDMRKGHIVAEYVIRRDPQELFELEYKYGITEESEVRMISEIPIDLLADGYKALISLMIPVLLGARAVIIEEPEQHAHPGLLVEFARIMAESDVQFIVSTHSLEFLEYLIDELDERGRIDDLTVIRMFQVSWVEAGYEVIRGREAREYLRELGADLRGT